MQLRHEKMSEHFEKYHITGLPFNAVLHHFTGIAGENAHDHPWSFTTHILSGGYREKIFHHANGIWTVEIIQRKPGTAHYVEATCIHEIIELPTGECWTLVLPEPCQRDACFWQFDEKSISFRKWYEREFTPLQINNI